MLEIGSVCLAEMVAVHLPSGAASAEAVNVGGMALEPSPDPIPARIAKGPLAVEIADFCTLPASSTQRPLAALNYLFHAGDGMSRVFVCDTRGKLWQVGTETSIPELVLDVGQVRGNRFMGQKSQMGLRGFAFHPDFAKAGGLGFRKLFTVHTEAAAEPEDSIPLFAMAPGTPVDHHNVLTEWGARPTEPLAIDPDSRREVLRIAQNRPDHCTDQLVFNPAAVPGDVDYGMLYVGTGDGGNTPERPDRYEHAQDPASALGKILRIDPLRRADGGGYRVPADNPFVGREGWLPEIWALGLRHPQNMSFDGPTGALVLTDIGQFFIEEVNLGVRGGNYGWPRREGTFATDRGDQTRLHALPDDDASLGYVYPVAQYDHDEGRTSEGTPIAKGRVAITGGFVCRDVAIPALAGQYLFGDLVNGRVFHVALAELVPGQLTTVHELTLMRNHAPVTLRQLVGTAGRVDLRFGQDERGAIYLLTKQDGAVRKLASG